MHNRCSTWNCPTLKIRWLQTNFLDVSQTFVPRQKYWKCAGPSVTVDDLQLLPRTSTLAFSVLKNHSFAEHLLWLPLLFIFNSWYVLSTSICQLFHLSWFFNFFSLFDNIIGILYSILGLIFLYPQLSGIEQEPFFSFSFFGGRILLHFCSGHW